MKELKLKPITNQVLWEIAKMITDRQKTANEMDTTKVDWNMLEGEWFYYLEEVLTIQED